MTIKLANNVSTTIRDAISSSATEIIVALGTGARFPVLAVGDYFYSTLQDTAGNLEIVRVSARSGDALTVTRAQEGTTARSFPTGSRIELRVTAQSVLDALSTATNYQGASATNPVTRLDGSPLVVGDFYFNTVENQVRFYNGSTWVPVASGSITRNDFSGNGSTVAFTLSRSPSTEDNTQVYINGVYQEKSSYSVSGTTLTFGIAPPSGSTIEVMVIENVGVVTADLVGYSPAGSGAVSTNVQTKLRETVSVKDFGAVGDGVTDDTAAIQAAIDYASTTGGNQVLFPSGRYNTSSTINITADGISLVGHGERNTIIQPIFSVGDVFLIAPTGAATRIDCFAMDGFTIDPPSAHPRTSGALINLTNAYQTNVSNIEFRDCFVGLRVTGGNSAHQVFENLVMRGIIAGTGVGILLEDGIDQMFNYISINNAVGFEPLAGIKIEQNQALWIDNSDILRCQYGMLIAPGASQLVTWSFISNTAFDYCSIDGVRISPFDDTSVINGLQFVGCWTSSCTERGFHITKAGSTTVDNIPKGVKLNSHRAVNNGSNGFLATTGTQIDIANSYFGGNGKNTPGTLAGIQFNDIQYFSVTTSGSGWQFGYSSTIQATGLNIVGSANFYRVIGNDFYGNLVKGLADTSSSTTKQVFGNTPATDGEDTFTLGAVGANSLKSIYTASDTWDPTTILAGGYGSRSITVAGAEVGDVVTATLSSIGFEDFVISAVVATTNQVRVIIRNISASPVDLPSGTLNVMVTKLGA